MTRLIDADALLDNIKGVPQLTNCIYPPDVYDLITNAPTVQREENKIIEYCLTKLSELKAPKNYNSAESHAYEQAHTDCWIVVRKLLDSEFFIDQREGWVSVEDRLPDTHGNYLVVGSYAGVRAASYMGLGNQSYFQDHLTSNDEGMCDEDGLEFAVTLWQPMPDAPTDTE